MSANSLALLWTLLAVFGALLGGTFVRIVALRGAAESVVETRLSSLRTWWILAITVAVAVIAGPIGTATLLGAAGVLALWEFIAFVGWLNVGRPVVGGGIVELCADDFGRVVEVWQNSQLSHLRSKGISMADSGGCVVFAA